MNMERKYHHMTEYMDIYVEEVKEHLENINAALLILEKKPDNKEELNTIFRAAHTIKGSSAAMGFVKIENLTHGMENILQDIREGKIEADHKIIELLFVCCDFLEDSLEYVICMGTEEDIKIDDILNKLHEIIEERQGQLQIIKTNAYEEDADSDDFTIMPEDEKILDEYTREGYMPYKLEISLKEDSPLKLVRIWMIFEEVSEHGDVISSEPIRPTADEIKNGTYSFDGTLLKLFIVSKDEENLLYEKLIASSDIEYVTIAPIETKKDYTSVSLSRDKLVEVNPVFLQDFMLGIKVQLEKIENYTHGLENDSEDSKGFCGMFRCFHTIKGIAGFIDNVVIYDIADQMERRVNDRINKGKKIGKNDIELILDAVNYLHNISDDLHLIHNKEFINKVNKDLFTYEKNKSKKDEHKKIKNIDKDQRDESKKGNKDQDKRNKDQDKKDKVLLKENKQELTIKEESKAKSSSSTESGYMRIAIQKVDNLVDMLGELLIQHSLIQQEAEAHLCTSNQYMNHLMRMSKMIKDIQNLSMSLRMISLKSTFQKLLRIGRDTAMELGKEVDIFIIGEETEVDRNVAEKVLDPLMHLVRNAVSHGIEQPEERDAKGKNIKGQISIQAYSKRGNVYIEVKDDGKGLSVDKIYEKASRQNLIDSSMQYTEEEIIKFIFLPGFSTQETINNISGRGVGMNVVETEVTKIGGKIEISNKPGEGCSFILKIPINLAIMNGTIVDILGSKYIIPTLYIKQFLKPEEKQWVHIRGKKKMLRCRDEIIPIIPILEEFEFKGESKAEDQAMIIIMEVEQELKALPVRAVLGRQEVVAKPLGSEFNGIRFASGASILGDGKVSLILDVEALFKVEGER